MAHAVSRLTRIAVVGMLAYQLAHISHLDHADQPGDHPAGDRESDQAGGLGERIVALAMTERGVEYSWGGGTTTGKTRGICCSPAGADGRETIGYDCSGLVLYAVYQASGGRITLPRTAAKQARRGVRIPRTKMRPGDLIGFDHRDGHGVTHIGIYIGHGQMINAPQTGDVVRVSPLGPREGQRWIIRRLP